MNTLVHSKEATFYREMLQLIRFKYPFPIWQLPSLVCREIKLSVVRIPTSEPLGKAYFRLGGKGGGIRIEVCSNNTGYWSAEEEFYIGHELAHYLYWKVTGCFPGPNSYYLHENYCEAFAVILTDRRSFALVYGEDGNPIRGNQRWPVLNQVIAELS